MASLGLNELILAQMRPDNTKPVPKPVLTYHQRCSVAFTWQQQVLIKLIRNMCLEIALWKLLPHLPNANWLFWHTTNKTSNLILTDLVTVCFSMQSPQHGKDPHGIYSSCSLLNSLVEPWQHTNMPGSWWHIPDSKVHGAIMGPIWGRQDPGGPHVGPINFAIWDVPGVCFTNLPNSWMILCVFNEVKI